MSLFNLRHTTEGQATLAEMLAKKYVERGAWWLQKHAPHGWYRNCLDGMYSRIHTCRSNEGPPAIAFEFCPEFADEFGYVVEWKVQKHFGLSKYSSITHRLGFDVPLGNYRPFKRHSEIVITPEMLDKAWQAFLTNLPGEWRIMYRHPTAMSRRWERLKRLDDPKRFSIGRWLENLIGGRPEIDSA